MGENKSRRRPATPENYELNSPIQQLVAQAFEARRKAINFGVGNLRITRHAEPDAELELWFSHGDIDPYELVLWVLPDWAAIVEARSLNRKRYAKKLFRVELDLRCLAVDSKRRGSVAAARLGAEKLVRAFENSIGAFTIRGSDAQVKPQLEAIWRTISSS